MSTASLISPLPFRRFARLLAILAALFALAGSACAEGGDGDGDRGGEKAGQPRFDVWEYRVTGNSRLSVEAVEKAVYPHLGPGKTLDDVQAAAAALEQAYRDAGYSTVIATIPEQSVTGGVVEIAVTEGRIDRVRVTGAKYYDQERLLAEVPALKEGAVPDFNALQGQLAAVGRNQDRRVQPLLRPGREPGTTEVELKVDDSAPLHGSVEFNNRYSPSRAPDPGDYRLSGTVRYDNLWQRQHSLSLSYLTAPGHTDEAKISSLSYSLPTGGPDELLTLYAVHSDSTADLTTSMAGTSVLGRANILGLRYAEPLRGVAGVNHGLTYGLDYKRLGEDMTVEGTGAYSTPLAYWLGSLQYNGGLTHDDGDTGFGAGVLMSVRGLTRNEGQFGGTPVKDDYGNVTTIEGGKRYRGRGNFLVLPWSLQRVQHLPGKFDLVGRLEGQFATQPLPSSEEYAIGGANSVRGYPEGTQMGDHGLRGMLELRTPNLIESDPPWGDLRLLVFFEGAQVRVLEPLPGQIDRFTLSSRGVGLRFATRHGLMLTLDYGWRLKDGQTTDTHRSVASGGGMVQFNLGLQL